jgi:hypothetical protein
MIFCAASELFQRFGSSAWAFSSARRFWAVSQSKMPPQQSDRLLGGFGERFDFGAHRFESKQGSGLIKAASAAVNRRG